MAFLTALELLRTALGALGNPVGDVAPSIPLCVGKEKFSAAIFFHRVRIAPKAYVAYPPSFLVTLDLESGRILARREILPKDIGPDASLLEPLPRHPDERRLQPEEIEDKNMRQARLLDHFQESWELFARGAVRLTPAQRAQVAQSIDDFELVATKRILPWYEGLGAPLLAWMRAVRAKPAP